MFFINKINSVQDTNLSSQSLNVATVLSTSLDQHENIVSE